MQTLLYDGTFDGWLCAVFAVYEYRFTDVDICTEARFGGNLFGKVYTVTTNRVQSERVWKGLGGKLSDNALEGLYHAFLSEELGIENVLLQYAQYAFRSPVGMESDFSHAAVVRVGQAAKRVTRERHRMEAFIRFQKTGDGLYYAVVEPKHNVLPLLDRHFAARFTDQKWMIFDAKRKWGIYYDGVNVETVTVQFSEGVGGTSVVSVYDADEAFYQLLWQKYFESVNISARKNQKLQLQHMPRRYWKYLTEKQPRV